MVILIEVFGLDDRNKMPVRARSIPQLEERRRLYPGPKGELLPPVAVPPPKARAEGIRGPKTGPGLHLENWDGSYEHWYYRERCRAGCPANKRRRIDQLEELVVRGVNGRWELYL